VLNFLHRGLKGAFKLEIDIPVPSATPGSEAGFRPTGLPTPDLLERHSRLCRVAERTWNVDFKFECALSDHGAGKIRATEKLATGRDSSGAAGRCHRYVHSLIVAGSACLRHVGSTTDRMNLVFCGFRSHRSINTNREGQPQCFGRR